MKASDVNFEVGDQVVRTTDWGELEYGTVTAIQDGPEVSWVEVQTVDDAAFGEYTPEQWEKADIQELWGK